MRNRKIEQTSFALAMRRDGSLHTEEQRTKYGSPLILQSLRTLENYDIIYDKGQLRTRKGFERYTTNELPGTPKQLFYHTILSRNDEFIFAICNTTVDSIVADRWYRVNANTTHDLIKDEAATSLDDGYRKPILSWGDRVFFGTDSGWYWTDRNRVYDTTKWYHAGIQKPTSPLQISAVAGISQINSSASEIRITRLEKRKIAFAWTSAYKIQIGAIQVSLKRNAAAMVDVYAGSLRMKIYTNSGDEPSATLAHEDAISEWLPTNIIPFNYTDYRTFYFSNPFDLNANTKYWCVIEADDAYYDAYNENLNTYYFISADVALTPIYDISKVYDTSGTPDIWKDDPDGVEINFKISGLSEAGIYEYIYTYYNSTYSIESRPSTYARLQMSNSTPVVLISGHASTIDDQVDKIRVYRRNLNDGMSIDEVNDDLITDTYKLVGELAIGDQWYDSVSTIFLGAELQTDDHYCLREADDTNMNLRGAIVPIGAVIWKGRVWVWVKDSNKLYFSKRLSENGASGLAGDMIPDFFPLENELEIEYPSAILNARPLSGDQLAIYFRNGSIWILWGMDEPANPPDDYALREMITTIGLTASGGLTEFRGSHIYLARQGLYRFMGGPTPEFLSEFVQSILDSISDTCIIETRLITNGEEMWILVDEDNDGYKETVYILDMQKSVPTWRRYNYGVNIADFVVKTLGTEQRTILAADATNNHIIELQIGTTDNGLPIDSYLETHQVRISQARFNMIEIYASYSDVGQFCDVTLYDHLGNEFNYQINPISSDDARGHKTGLRAYAKSTFRLKLSQSTVEETDLLGFLLSYVED